MPILWGFFGYGLAEAFVYGAPILLGAVLAALVVGALRSRARGE